MKIVGVLGAWSFLIFYFIPNSGKVWDTGSVVEGGILLFLGSGFVGLSILELGEHVVSGVRQTKITHHLASGIPMALLPWIVYDGTMLLGWVSLSIFLYILGYVVAMSIKHEFERP